MNSVDMLVRLIIFISGWALGMGEMDVGWYAAIMPPGARVWIAVAPELTLSTSEPTMLVISDNALIAWNYTDASGRTTPRLYSQLAGGAYPPPAEKQDLGDVSAGQFADYPPKLWMDESGTLWVCFALSKDQEGCWHQDETGWWIGDVTRPRASYRVFLPILNK